MTSFKWYNVRSFVASISGLCGSAVTIVGTVFGGVVIAPACGNGSAFQESAVGAVLGAGLCANVTAQADQKCEPDTIVSGNAYVRVDEPDTCVSGASKADFEKTRLVESVQVANGLEQQAANGVEQKAANGVEQQAANGVAAVGAAVDLDEQLAVEMDEQFVWGASEPVMYFDLRSCTYKYSVEQQSAVKQAAAVMEQQRNS